MTRLSGVIPSSPSISRSTAGDFSVRTGDSNVCSHSRCTAPGMRPPRCVPRLFAPVHSPSERTSQKTWFSSSISAGMSSSLQIESLRGAAGAGYSLRTGAGCR